MTDDVNVALERLKHNDDQLFRVVLGDPATRQIGMLEQLVHIQSMTKQIQIGIQRLWIAVGMVVVLMTMLVFQLIWHSVGMP